MYAAGRSALFTWIKIKAADCEKAGHCGARKRGSMRGTSMYRYLAVLLRTNARLMRRIARLERELAEARELAFRDLLTGLPNRRLLLDRLGQAVQQASRQYKSVGLLLVDVDCFKSVNDRFGHAAGDQLLQQVAARMSGCIRGCDTAARYGGDEFVVMLPELASAEEAGVVAQKVSECFAEPYRLDGRDVGVGASIGTAILSEGAGDCGDLIRAADTAMYLSKASRSAPLHATSHRPVTHTASQ